MYFSKMTIKHFYVICEAYNKEAEEVKTIRGELGDLLSDKDIVDLQEILSGMTADDYGGDDSSLEQDCYRQLSYELESLLNDGNEFQEVCIYRSLSDSYYNDPLYLSFIPYEDADNTSISDQKEEDDIKPIRLTGSNVERFKRLAQKRRAQKEE